MSKLVNTFGVCGLGLLLAGCGAEIDGNCMGGFTAGPVSAKGYNQKCADNQTSQILLESDRPEMVIAGAVMAMNMSPEAKKAFEEVGKETGGKPVKKISTECVVVGRKETSTGGKLQLAC